MTLVEVFLFLLAAFGIYLLLAPLRKRIEFRLYKFFRSRSRGSDDVIDITEYSKKDKK